MTQRKPRSFEPYTNRAVCSALGGFSDPLEKALREYFVASACAEINKRIHEAVGHYDLAKKTNPDRKVTREQQKDRHELIETMKELNMRLFPHHIPSPLYDPARTAYTPHKRGKPDLRDEIADLLLRMRHLQQLFESIEIPTPKKTNPGKPERDQLVEALTEIYCEFANAIKNPRDHAEDKRLNFIKAVFDVFHLEDPIPRNA
jgi:hypothetical protein